MLIYDDVFCISIIFNNSIRWSQLWISADKVLMLCSRINYFTCNKLNMALEWKLFNATTMWLAHGIHHVVKLYKL